MSQFHVYARLAKVDEAKRQVTGIIASETPDNAREVFDYDSSKPHFEKWSGDVSKASDGKSVGNLRAMHGKVAAGRLTDITFDDVAKTIEVVADIVDDNEWEKVLKGVYTGFSIGGKYLRKWADTVNKSLKRYTASPHEVSLVDMGCNPDSGFILAKMDGSEETVPFHIPGQEELLAKIADPEASELEKRDALQQLNKAYGVGDNEEDAEGDALEKGAYSIGQLARLAEDAMYIVTGYGCNIDGTMTAFSDDVKKGASALYDGLLKMVNADVEQAKIKLKEVRKMMDEEGEGALMKMNIVNDITGDGPGIVHVHESLGKFLSNEEGINNLTKFIADNDELQKKLDTETSEHNATKAELAKVKGEPAPAVGAVKAVPAVVSKENDNGGEPVAKVDDPKNPEAQDPLALVKSVHASGGRQFMGGSFTTVNGQ